MQLFRDSRQCCNQILSTLATLCVISYGITPSPLNTPHLLGSMLESTLCFAELLFKPTLSEHGFILFSSGQAFPPRSSELSRKACPAQARSNHPAASEGSVTSVDGDRSHQQPLDLHLRGVLPVAPTVDPQQRGAAALGAQHRHVDERGVVRLAGVIGAGRPDPAVPQQQRQQQQHGGAAVPVLASPPPAHLRLQASRRPSPVASVAPPRQRTSPARPGVSYPI